MSVTMVTASGPHLLTLRLIYSSSDDGELLRPFAAMTVEGETDSTAVRVRRGSPMNPDVTPVASGPAREKPPPTPNRHRGGRTRRTRDVAPFASSARFSALVVALLTIGALQRSGAAGLAQRRFRTLSGGEKQKVLLNLAATYCDRLFVLDAGRVTASGTPEQMLVPETLLQVFGVRAHCGTHPLTGRRLLAFAPSIVGSGSINGHHQEDT